MITTDWKEYLDGPKVLKPLSNSYKVQFILDILEGCKYHCSGCFVKKRGNYSSEAIPNAINIAESCKEDSIQIDDLVIGPTDFFGADNILDVLRSRSMKYLCSYTKGIQHNTSIDENIDDSFVDEVIRFLEDNREYSSLNYDVQIAIDLDKLMADEKYRVLVDNRWDTFKRSKLKYEVSLLANIGESAISDEDVQEFVRDRWGTVVEYVPSIMRSHNFSKVKDTLDSWKSYDNSYNLHADKAHKTYNHITLNINKDKVYLAPFIYEVAAVYSKDYEVPPNIEGVIDSYNTIVREQYSYAGPTCQECPHLNECTHRLIPLYTVNSLGEKDYCPLNLEFL
ncbi:MAG: hypothetical protein NZ811_02760 [Gammaproteobacteria bacterium]|nr:hypothetical protein [Gammaproteobacteria bacterium]